MSLGQEASIVHEEKNSECCVLQHKTRNRHAFCWFLKGRKSLLGIFLRGWGLCCVSFGPMNLMEMESRGDSLPGEGNAMGGTVVSGVLSEDTQTVWLSGQKQIYPLQWPDWLCSALRLYEMRPACLSHPVFWAWFTDLVSEWREPRFRLRFSASVFFLAAGWERAFCALVACTDEAHDESVGNTNTPAPCGWPTLPTQCRAERAREVPQASLSFPCPDWQPTLLSFERL